MPPSKGGNSKKEAGRARKEEQENVKKGKVAAAKEAAEAKDWEDGAKSNAKADAAKQKAAEAERKKAEKAALLAAEEASLPSKPKAPTGPKKKAPKPVEKPAGPGALAAGGGLGGVSTSATSGGSTPKDAEDDKPVHLAATGLDNMLEALELVNAKSDKSSVGAKAGMIEKHPERRFKAAFEAYLDREMPKLKEDHPGLRKQQMHDIIFKQFQKAPENPFNQATVAYDASKEERVEALKANMAEKEKQFRVKE